MSAPPEAGQQTLPHKRSATRSERTSARAIVLTYCATLQSLSDEGKASQEVRRPDRRSRARVEDGAPEGDPARSRARRFARERRVPGGEGASDLRQRAHRHVETAPKRDRADEPGSNSSRQGGVRLEGDAAGERSGDGLRAGDAGGCGCRKGPHLDLVADRSSHSEQGRG